MDTCGLRFFIYLRKLIIMLSPVRDSGRIMSRGEGGWGLGGDGCHVINVRIANTSMNHL